MRTRRSVMLTIAVTSHLVSRRRYGGAALVVFAVTGALLGFLLTSGPAAGYGVSYCANWYASGKSCEGPNHTLTANIAYDDTGSNAFVCETATNSSGNSVGGWGCGYGYAESCYAGNQLLHGWIANASHYWLYMNGSEYYSQGCP
jgi:hypothetical protein